MVKKRPNWIEPSETSAYFSPLGLSSNLGALEHFDVHARNNYWIMPSELQNENFEIFAPTCLVCQICANTSGVRGSLKTQKYAPKTFQKFP